MIPSKRLAIVVSAAVLAGACAPDSPTPLAPDTLQLSQAETGSGSLEGLEFTGRIILIGSGSRLPNNLEARVRAAGGEIVATIPEIGVAFAEARSGDFAENARRIPGMESVVPDVMLQWTHPDVGRGEVEITPDFPTILASIGISSAHTMPTDPFFVGLQWAPQAIQAPEAWAAGFTGQGVRVAILDGGIRHTHVDLVDNIDVAASRSFATGAWNSDTGTFWHGTHVAGIVAAKANGIGTVGVAPNATIVGVKVLHSGSGAFEWILNGIVYAARPIAEGGAGAHIINMSLGASIDYRTWWQDKEFRDWFREWTKVYDRATRYAYQQGVTVIASAGNGATNHDVAKQLFKLPAQNQHVLSISATGPHGWALGATDFYRPAYYTDHGKSLVDLAAPGGTYGLWVVDGYDGFCTVAGITNWCEVFDLVLSTSRGSGASNTSYSWAQGTSMAAPMAAGVAALIIEANGVGMHPAQVRARLQQSAADLGAPGKDEWYGHGWVNAFRAVGGVH
jgi:lantibiotic leader peptide-processing serine protease